MPIVAMWKDPVRGVREIPLESGAESILLTVCSDRALDVAVCQVRAANATAPIQPKSDRADYAALEDYDLTVLTGWAEAIVEALAYAPHRIERVAKSSHNP
jgi:hypothetical protein